MRLKEYKKLKFWSESFGHSFSDGDRLGGTSDEWFLTEVIGVYENPQSVGGGYLLRTNIKRIDGMMGTKGIFSDDKIFLKLLEVLLKDKLGISWEEIGNLEI